MTILGAAATPAMPETTKEEIKAKSAALNKKSTQSGMFPLCVLCSFDGDMI